MRGRRPDDHQPPAQIKQMFQEGELKAGDKKTIRVFFFFFFQKSWLQIILGI